MKKMTVCSLMQKDVLIEEVSAVASQIVKIHPDSFTSLPEFLSCTQLRDQLYRSRPEQICLEEIHSDFEKLKNITKIKPENNVSDVLDALWLFLSSNTEPVAKPTGIVLGGQPGAGKSVLTQFVLQSDSNFIVINADEFRSWHHSYESIQDCYQKDSAKQTGRFAGHLAEKILLRAIKGRYNLIIEGTFRTYEIPNKTMNKLKEAGYRTEVYLKTCPKAVSWERCLARYKIAQDAGEGQERFTSKEHHDLVVAVLPTNADVVMNSGLSDRMIVVDDNGQIIFDSDEDSIKPSTSIYSVLERKKSSI